MIAPVSYLKKRNNKIAGKIACAMNDITYKMKRAKNKTTLTNIDHLFSLVVLRFKTWD